MTETQHSLDELHSLCMRALMDNGCDEVNACAVVDTVIAAERDHCKSHGLLRIPGYVKALQVGRANGKAKPSIKSLAPGILQVHGDNGFAPVALSASYDPLAERAHEQGVAVASLVRVHHFAALWPEMEALCARGLVAIAMTSALPIVAPAGGNRPLFGTNPIAFGWPRDDADPIIFDQATAAMAHGEVLIAEREGRSLPDGVALNKDGEATNDPGDVRDGSLLAFGGTKGALLSMMVELMAGALLGESFSFETGAAHDREMGTFPGGEILIAFDPAKFSDNAGWSSHAERLFAEILNQPGARLPSDRRYKARPNSLSDGVLVRDDMMNDVAALCAT